MGRSYRGSMRSGIIQRDGGKCAYGSIFKESCSGKTHIDHENSWKNGGQTTRSNGITSCAKHNLEKGGRNALNYIWDKSGPK